VKLTKQTVCKLFENSLQSKNMSLSTRIRYLREVKHFFEIGIAEDIRDVNREMIFAYIVKLKESKNEKDEIRFAPSVIQGMISTLRILFSYLYRCEYIVFNPFDDASIKLKGEKGYRLDVSIAQMNRFLSAIESDTFLGLRDRTIFELLYATGLRVGELVSLDVEDIDMSGKRLFVKLGKGGKDRVIPIAGNALCWIVRYMKTSRPAFVHRGTDSNDARALFLSMKGRRLSRAGVEERAKHYSKVVWNSEMHITPHIFRHSFASHLLINGAGVKDVSVLLGHASVDSTVGYTHFTIRSLKKIMKQFHPRENNLYIESGKLPEIRSILNKA
jgi:integrase/recombinase XerD